MVGVYTSTDRKGATMTKDHPRPGMELAQGALLNNPGFLREIVERVLQEELLEAEMTEHIGAAPTSAPRGAPGIATAASPGGR
jgi:hypothetical protein